MKTLFGQFICYCVLKRDSFKVGMLAHLKAKAAFGGTHIKLLSKFQMLLDLLLSIFILNHTKYD